MLAVRDIHTSYDGSYVLQGVSIKVEKGHVVTLLGRNGVGKTTLIRSIIGFTHPHLGTIEFKGRDITRLPPHRIATMGIGLVPQGRRIFPSLAVAENLSVVARGGKERAWDIDRVFATFPRLSQRKTQLGSRLSGGEQQMLAFARGIISNPDLLLLDEPSEGLAPLLLRELGKVVQDLKDEGMSVLVVEQNLPFALKVADYVYVMSKGRIVFEGRPDDLWHNERVKHQYLGI